MSTGVQEKGKGVHVIDVTLTAFDKVRTVSLLGLMMSFTIKESIFENCVNGHLVIQDGIGLSMFLPLVGEEVLTMKFAHSDVPEWQYNKTFRVYKISEFERDPQLPTASIYKVHFISEEFLKNESVRVQRSYKGQLISDMVNDLYQQFLYNDRPIFVEPTQNAQQFVIGNKTPLQAINLLCTYSQSASTKASFCLFYEDRIGFRFTNLKTLYERESLFKFTVEAENLDRYGENRSKALTPSNLIPFYVKHKHSFDMLQAVSAGMFFNQVDAVDFVSKTTQVNTFNYKDEFNKDTHLSSTSLFPFASSTFDNYKSQCYKIVNSRNLRQSSKYFTSHDQDGVNLSKTYEAYLPQRMSTYQQQEFLELEMGIAGNTGLTAGDTIELELDSRSQTEDSKTNQRHKYLAGKYLIKALEHNLYQNKFTTRLWITRDCYSSVIENKI